MPIDWFTVCAQALNFLVLVWLLKRFLYKPILRAVDARETRIAKELADADAKKAEAQKESDEFRLKNETFDQARAACESRMKSEVEAERQRLLSAARQAADALAAQQMDALRADARNLRQAIGRRAQKEVFAIARKVLSDLAGTSLEAQMADVFASRLRALGDSEKERLSAAVKDAPGPVLVRSAFALPEAQQAAIESAVRDAIAAGASVRFETAPDLVGGIDLAANGQKISWDIAAYLLSLEKGVGELLEAKEETAGDEPAETAKP